MIKLKSIVVDVYGFEIFYLFSSWKHCVRRLKEEFSLNLDPKFGGDGYAEPLINDDGRHAYFIWVKSVDYDDVIVHEAFHATAYIMDDFAGVKLTRNSDEAYAYLLGYITRELFKARRKSERKGENGMLYKTYKRTS